MTQTRPLGSQAVDSDYFVEEVRRQLYAKYGQAALYDGGLQVRSTLDTRLQNYAVNALRAGLVRYDRRHGWRGAVSNININGDWKNTLASAGNQSGIDTWRVAVVLGFDDDNTDRDRPRQRQRARRFRSRELAWARRELKDADRRCGADEARRSVQDRRRRSTSSRSTTRAITASGRCRK